MSASCEPTTFEELAANTGQSAPNWFAWAIAQPFESNFVTLNKTRIHYLGWNQQQIHKPVLLFIHGFRAHAYWWQYIAPFFTQQYRVLAMDFSGMGDSDHRDTYEADTHGNDIIGLLDSLGCQHATAICHSFGGSRTLYAAANRPDLFKQLILIDSDMRFVGDPLLIEPVVHSTPKIYASEADIRARFRLIPKQPEIYRALVEHIYQHAKKVVEGGVSWKFDPKIAGHSVGALTVDESLAKISLPIDFIYGTNSRVVDNERAASIFSRIPSARKLVDIPGGYHHLMLDQPTALIAAIKALLL